MTKAAFSFEAQSKGLDGLASENSKIAKDAFALTMAGGKASSQVKVRISRKDELIEAVFVSDENGSLTFVDTASDALTKEALSKLGGATWDCAGPYRIVIDDITIEVLT